MFTGLTVFVLATNEQKLLIQSLRKTIESCGAENIAEIIIVLINSFCPAAEMCKKIGSSFEGVRCKTYVQKSKDIAQVFFEIPALAKSSHFVIIAADMEMDPESLRLMLQITKEKPESIVCAAKWAKGSIVKGYGFFNSLGSKGINRFVARLIGSKAKDLFSIFEIYPKSVFDQMKYDPAQCLYEYSLRPVLSGVEYIEIPTIYNRRAEGKSNADFQKNIQGAIYFLKAAFRLKREKHRASKKTGF